MGTSLVVQCLRLHASNAGSVGSILVRELWSHMLCSAAKKRMKWAVKYKIRCCCLVAKSHPTLCDPMDCSLPGSSVRGIFQARILESGAIFFSRGSSQPRDRTWISCIFRGILYHWATWEAHVKYISKTSVRKKNIKYLNNFHIDYIWK